MYSLLLDIKYLWNQEIHLLAIVHSMISTLQLNQVQLA